MVLTAPRYVYTAFQFAESRREGSVALLGYRTTLDGIVKSEYDHRNARVAQWIERLPPEQKAMGSSPFPRTTSSLVEQAKHREAIWTHLPREPFDNHVDNH